MNGMLEYLIKIAQGSTSRHSPGTDAYGDRRESIVWVLGVLVSCFSIGMLVILIAICVVVYGQVTSKWVFLVAVFITLSHAAYFANYLLDMSDTLKRKTDET